MRPGTDGKLSYLIGKEWERLIPAAGLEPRKTFHSFRGMWTDAARRAGVPKEQRHTIAGRNATDNTVEDSYGDGYSVEDLRPWMVKIDPWVGCAA